MPYRNPADPESRTPARREDSDELAWTVVLALAASVAWLRVLSAVASGERFTPGPTLALLAALGFSVGATEALWRAWRSHRVSADAAPRPHP